MSLLSYKQNVSDLKGENVRFPNRRETRTKKFKRQHEVAANVSFRQVQFISPTLQFTLQKLFFLHFVFARFFFSVNLPCMNIFLFYPHIPHHFSNGLSHTKNSNHERQLDCSGANSQVKKQFHINLGTILRFWDFNSIILAFHTDEHCNSETFKNHVFSAFESLKIQNLQLKLIAI